MKLSVIIVNYNVKHYLRQCLDSVLRAISGIDAEVFVVDNHSRDGSVGYLERRYTNVMFIECNHNLGFARANNIAIRQPLNLLSHSCNVEQIQDKLRTGPPPCHFLTDTACHLFCLV